MHIWQAPLLPESSLVHGQVFILKMVFFWFFIYYVFWQGQREIKRQYGKLHTTIKSLIDKLRADDAKIIKRIDKVQRNSRAVIQLLMERHKVYLKYENMATDITTRFNISTRREDIFLEVMIYKVKADMEDDMSQIFTRLDDLETKVQALIQGKQQK
jgi:hypothetical protein